MAQTKVETVKLKTKARKDYKSKSQTFDVEHANRILKLPKSQWQLDDKNWKWNGQELAKA